MKEDEIKKKIDIIPKVIKFSWDYKHNYNLFLSISTRDYKIFINEKYEKKKIKDVYFKIDFGQYNYEIEERLIDISNSKFVGEDYKAKFIAKSFEEILSKKYKNNFNFISFENFCFNIDNNFCSYYRYKSINKDLRLFFWIK